MCDDKLLFWLLLLYNKLPKSLLAYNYLMRLRDSVGQEFRQGMEGMAFLYSMLSVTWAGKT